MAAARAIVTNLSSLNFSNAPLTAERAVWLRERLAQLSVLGTNALPAIADFFQRNEDLIFDGPKQQELAGAPSLRVALIELVGSAPGPQAVVWLKSMLAATADPVELATLAKVIERAAPRAHQAEFVTAARETLALAASNQWDGRDVAPLFEMLRVFGGAAVVADVERWANPWFHYAPMTLLELPDGAGVPALIKLAQENDERQPARRAAFLRTLADAAAGHPTAAEELLAQTRADKIAPPAWPGIGASLAGYTLRFARPVLTAPATTRPGSVHVAPANQNLMEATPPENSPANEIGDRIRLVDRLLEATTNPTALDALEGARIQLSERLSRVPSNAYRTN